MKILEIEAIKRVEEMKAGSGETKNVYSLNLAGQPTGLSKGKLDSSKVDILNY